MIVRVRILEDGSISNPVVSKKVMTKLTMLIFHRTKKKMEISRDRTEAKIIQNRMKIQKQNRAKIAS